MEAIKRDLVPVVAAALVAFTGMAMAVKAEPAPVVLTPTALYDKIEKLEKKHSKVLKVILNQNKKISALEKKVSELQKQLEASKAN